MCRQIQPGQIDQGIQQQRRSISEAVRRVDLYD